MLFFPIEFAFDSLFYFCFLEKEGDFYPSEPPSCPRLPLQLPATPSGLYTTPPHKKSFLKQQQNSDKNVVARGAERCSGGARAERLRTRPSGRSPPLPLQPEEGDGLVQSEAAPGAPGEQSPTALKSSWNELTTQHFPLGTGENFFVCVCLGLGGVGGV